MKDPALQSLLRGLAQRPFPGSCVVTTREPIRDLAPFHGKTVAEWGLDHLSDEAGAALLRQACAKGTEAELCSASQEVKGHALTLQLMGGYVALAHEGDIRRRDRFGFQRADEQVQGGHAFRVIEAYERWLPLSAESGERELAVLRLLGLFDRPADGGCLAALRREPAIPGLTEPLINLTDADWNTTLKRLESLGLVTLTSDQSQIANPQSAIVDSHPLIREYFAKQLQAQQPDAWRAAHRRLYEHLTETTEHQPATLDALQPLYQAVVHGCQAGSHAEALNDVYDERILRGKCYSMKKLGAVGADLGAVACFFEQPWCRLSPSLSRADQAWLLSEAAFRLRALGRLSEAVEPMRASLRMAVAQEGWKEAGTRASNLSELELTLGEVDRAVEDGQQAVTSAERSGDWQESVRGLPAYGDALHQAGRWEEAGERFSQAEAMQAKMQSGHPRLYSFRGFRYCDLLLSKAERSTWRVVLRGGISTDSHTAPEGHATTCATVAERAAETLRIALRKNWPLAVALDYLMMGRAALYRATLSRTNTEQPTPDAKSAPRHLDTAIDGLRKSSQLDDLPRGLLTRALLRHVEGDDEGAARDLDDAWDIAARGPMRLYMADVQLTRARLFRDKAALAEARKLIEECGYHRRDEELSDAEQAAEEW